MTVPAEIIILSSSPDPPRRTPKKAVCGTETCSAISPPAATPPSLLRLPSRSRFFPTPSAPSDATKKKGRSKLKAASVNGIDKHDSSKSQEKTKKATNGPKSDVLADLEPGYLGSRKNIVTKPARPQKGRSQSSAKTKEQGNMTLAGKVTKSSNEPKGVTKRTKKAPDAQKSSFENQQTESRKPSALEKDEDLHLDEAMRRRIDWTPPRETNSKGFSAGDDGGDVANESNQSSGNAFGTILSDYNYSGRTSAARDMTNALGEGPTKRRRIELVDAQVYPPATKKSGVKDVPSGQEDDSSSSGAQLRKKTKSQKSFKTLTARMTAQYTNDTEDDDGAINAIVPDVGKAKSRRGEAKKTKDEETEFVVLSPDAVFKTLDDQNLIFGTCSQLERDDSPETLREMQQAMCESESLASQRRHMARPGGADCASRQSASHTSMSRLTGARNLWGVATRNTEGSLVQGQNLGLVDLTDITEASAAENGLTAKAPAVSLDDDWFELDYGKPASAAEAAPLSERQSRPLIKPKALAITESSASVESTQLETTMDPQTDSQQSRMPRYEGFTDAELSKQVAAYGFKSVRGRKKMIELLQMCWESKHGKRNKETRAQSTARPATSEATQNDATAAQLASNSTKAKPKGQSQSKQKKAQPVQRVIATSLTSKKSLHKAPKSDRPPSPPSIDVEEIQDSEEEAFLSPTQVQKRYTKLLSNATDPAIAPSLEFLPGTTPQSPIKCKTPATKASRTSKASRSSSAKSSVSEPFKRNSLPDLLTQITKAIRAQPKLSALSSPLGSRSRPTWHEKILMYDPVILEDLTTWLNVEGLGLVGEDREVGAAIVREWCEGRGICCCWKKNASW